MTQVKMTDINEGNRGGQCWLRYPLSFNTVRRRRFFVGIACYLLFNMDIWRWRLSLWLYSLTTISYLWHLFLYSNASGQSSVSLESISMMYPACIYLLGFCPLSFLLLHIMPIPSLTWIRCINIIHVPTSLRDIYYTNVPKSAYMLHVRGPNAQSSLHYIRLQSWYLHICSCLNLDKGAAMHPAGILRREDLPSRIEV